MSRTIYRAATVTERLLPPPVRPNGQVNRLGQTPQVRIWDVRPRRCALLISLTLIAPLISAQTSASAPAVPKAGLLQNGTSLFQQNCAFCHGRDAGGGETGPDLTRSKIVADDVGGNKIGPIVRNGITDKGMPKFALPDNDIAALVAFIHEAKTKAESQKGGRRGVDPSDLTTGNAEAGKQYFNGAGGCARCHSPTGDLAGVAGRREGLALERAMLYPRNPPATATVTLPSGETVEGKLIHRDEFTIALRDASGRYRSWFVDQVKVSVDSPADAHADLLAKYTDSDIHNLMAYLQTLK
jgi:cytochrome c oxidase cbb3-type subunit 3